MSEPNYDDNFEAQDVAEIVNDDAGPGADTIEIDMRNNSTTYLEAHGDSVYFIASHPTLPLVASGGGDDTVYLWTTTHTPPRIAAKLTEHTESIVAGGFTANGRFLVTGDMSGRLIVWKSSKGGEQWELMSNTQEADEIVNISMHPSLNMFAVSSSDGQVWCYEITDSLENVAVLSAHTLPATGTQFVPPVAGEEDAAAAKPLLLSISEDGLVILWDVYGQKVEYMLDSTKLRGDHAWVTLCLSPTNKTVAVGSMDGAVAIIKVADGALLNLVDTTIVKAEKPEDEGPVEPTSEDDAEEEQLGFSVEGLGWSSTGLLATGNVDGVVVVWDTKTWRPRFSFQLADSVTQLVFDGKLLTVSSMDGLVVQYDVISSERVWELLGHNEGVLGFAVQNGGQKVITAGDDHICLVFDKK